MSDTTNKQNDRLKAIGLALTSQATASRFQATDDQKRAKSTFWGSFGPEAVLVPGDTPNLSIALQYGDDSRISEWWVQPGFPEWFWNRLEYAQRMGYITMVAMDELETTLTSRMIPQAQKLAAIKLALELAGKLRHNEPAPPADERIAKMTRAELEQFISKRASLMAPQPEIPVNTGPSDPDQNEQ